jgi:hypothetical protein
MNEELKTQQVQQLAAAFRSLYKASHKTLMTGLYDGAGLAAVRAYERLHRRAQELVPDDFFISDVLTPVFTDSDTNDQQLSRVAFLSSQALEYLENLLRSSRRSQFEEADFRDLGRDLSEQIVSFTRGTLRRALSNIDVHLSTEDDETAGDARVRPAPPTPPVPPVPPVPPTPPEPPVPPAKPFSDPFADMDDPTR